MLKLKQKTYLNKPIKPNSKHLKTIKTIKITIIGAGPGNKELITIKGFKLIKEANIILFDNLVSKEIISIARLTTRKIYIGKKAGKKYIKQKAINKLIISLAKKGNNIVRLKGGDPYIFGRGGEEMKAIINNKIAFQIIPGITTAIGSTIGIPLTHRNYSNNIAFTTGSISYKNKPNWNLELNKKQTIIMYMYASNITKLKEKLLKSRFSNKTPIAIITSSTNKNQKIIISNIKSIESLSNNNTTPSILIIGNIIKLYRDLTTFN